MPNVLASWLRKLISPLTAWRRFRRWLALGLALWLALWLALPGLGKPPIATNDALAQQSVFNRLATYPVGAAPGPGFRPVADWVGRLVLPSPAEMAALAAEDWVWFEVYHAPTAAGIQPGDRLRLAWRKDPALARRVAALTRSVRFGKAAQAGVAMGNVLPERLAGRDSAPQGLGHRVGPLQSLAGARPRDDVLVRLESPELDPGPGQAGPGQAGPGQAGPGQAGPGQAAAKPGNSAVIRPVQTLRLAQEPVLVAERWQGLVKILGPVAENSDQFRIQHFNRATGRFDGPAGRVRIPAQPPGRDGLTKSTARGLESSPAGQAGWYVWGAPDGAGVFTIRAIAPRQLFRLGAVQPGADPAPPAATGEMPAVRTQVNGKSAAIGWVRDRLWSDLRAGTARQVGLDPVPSEPGPKAGNRALVVHVFGGIGGPAGERLGLPGTVTGHFAYGVATLGREELTGELEWQIEYDQVYAQNPEGIISGRHDWASYMGDLQRGWLGTRPVADGVAWLPMLDQPLAVGGQPSASLLEQLGDRLQLMAARYRIGDGTGSASVSPAFSCVQDSNQALWWTIAPWLDQSGQGASLPSSLQDLLEAIARNLSPLGSVRADWQTNARQLQDPGGLAVTPLAGIELAPSPAVASPAPSTQPSGAVVGALKSWRTIFPRQAHDDLLGLLLAHGAKVWLLRTDQVGGSYPTIAPLPPTGLFGLWTVGGVPVLTLAIARLWAAVTHGLNASSLVWMVLALGGIAGVILPVGLWGGFLRWQPVGTRRQRTIGAVWVFFLPALAEELVFRVLLLPHPAGSFDPGYWWGWAAVGLVIFLVYHPVQAWLWFPSGRSTFGRLDFLLSAAALGLGCTVVYWQTGSVWTATIVHWLTDWLWIYWLGGAGRLRR